MLSLSRLESPNFSTELCELDNLLDRCETKITFWGGRIIQTPDLTDSISLDAIANKILEVSGVWCVADQLTPNGQLAAVRIVRKLRGFYHITDSQIKNSNFFTKFLNWIREFSFFPYTIRFSLDEPIETSFLTYSKAEFSKRFAQGSYETHSAVAQLFANGERIVVKEECIAQLTTA